MNGTLKIKEIYPEIILLQDGLAIQHFVPGPCPQNEKSHLYWKIAKLWKYKLIIVLLFLDWTEPYPIYNVYVRNSHYFNLDTPISEYYFSNPIRLLGIKQNSASIWSQFLFIPGLTVAVSNLQWVCRELLLFQSVK